MLPSGQGSAAPAGTALVVVATTGLLLGVFVLAAYLLGRARRRRLRHQPDAPSPTTDAWAEAGRRLAVPTDDDQGPSRPD